MLKLSYKSEVMRSWDSTDLSKELLKRLISRAEHISISFLGTGFEVSSADVLDAIDIGRIKVERVFISLNRIGNHLYVNLFEERL